ncbi:MAG TPA: twin-arginine translocation signal domain-containing protein, partial [Chloroflexota bacterium]|nr:twin-arginine translocation signal domain-containing protein [Chloroflexota bacterium]
MSTSTVPVSRRSLLQMVAAGTGMVILAACGSSAQPPASPAPPSQGPASSPAAAAPSSAAAAAKPSTAASVAVSAPASAAAAASPSVQPKLGGTLQAIQAGDLASVDGHYYTPGAGLSAWIVFDTLTAYDDNLKPQPALAESWDQSTDLKSIKLNLRKGVTFHN